MPKSKHRVIIDTNLWVSFLLTKDFSKLDALINGSKVTLLFSDELLEEFLEVAQRPKFKKYFSISDLKYLLGEIQQNAKFINVISTVAICRDPKDNFLLSLALDGKATHLITGDKDLLDLNGFKDIKILKIMEYL